MSSWRNFWFPQHLLKTLRNKFIKIVQLTVIQLKKKYKKLIVHGELLETQKYVFQHNNLQRFLDFVDVVTCIKKRVEKLVWRIIAQWEKDQKVLFLLTLFFLRIADYIISLFHFISNQVVYVFSYMFRFLEQKYWPDHSFLLCFSKEF